MDITMLRRASESRSCCVAEDELGTAPLCTRLDPGMPHDLGKIGIADGALPMPRWQ
jgi:hypothetical protein